MIVVFKNTNFKLDITVTENNFGIKEDDKWCTVNLLINNEQFKYEIKKEILTLNEIKTTISILEDFLCNKIKNKIITYIKNFIKIKLITYKKEKTLELTVTEPKDIGNNSYKIIFENNDINELITILKKVL